MILDYFEHIRFAYPWVLYFLGIIPLLIYWYVKKGVGRFGSFKVSSLGRFQHRASWKVRLRNILIVLRMITLTSLIIALARPQLVNKIENTEGEGIDIVLCMDVSGSMLAQDFTPNRQEASKQVAAEFVRSRPTDRIGVVIFSGESFTQCPITTDHQMLLSQINNIRGGFMEDGTAIGSGLATSLERLNASQSPSKIVVLLTDGENNGGLIDPLTAKEMARSLGIKVYTIGVGSEGMAPTPVQTPNGTIVMQNERVNIDEKLLTEIADQTGGKYFRAKDNQSLASIYKEIDQMEKTKVEVRTTMFYVERFYPFALIAIVSLILELVLSFTVFRRFP